MKYSALDKINFFIALYGRLYTSIFRPSYWSLFFMLGLVQAFFLFAVTFFYYPVVQQTVYPLLRLLMPSDAFHYPRYYMNLPGLYSGIDTLIIGPTAWVIFTAAAIYKYSSMLKESPGASFGECFKKALGKFSPVLLFWLIQTVILIAVMYLPSLALAKYVFGSPRRKLLLDCCLQLLSVGIISLFIYALPSIIMEGKKVLQGIGISIKIFRKNFFLTFFIVFFPVLPLIIISIILNNFSFQITTQLNPDLIPMLILVKIVLGIFANMFIYYSAVAINKELG